MKQILCINLAAALAFACAGFLWKWRTQVYLFAQPLSALPQEGLGQ